MTMRPSWPHVGTAIRLMKYDPKAAYAFTAAETYSMDLAAANRKGVAEWKFEYDAQRAFGLADLSPASWQRWVQTSLAVDEAAFLKYMGFRRRGFQGPYSGGMGIGGGAPCAGFNRTCFATEVCYILHLSDAAAAKCVAETCRTVAPGKVVCGIPK